MHRRYNYARQSTTYLLDYKCRCVTPFLRQLFLLAFCIAYIPLFFWNNYQLQLILDISVDFFVGSRIVLEYLVAMM